MGFADDEDDGVPFEIKMPQLIDELEDQFAESERLQREIQVKSRGRLRRSFIRSRELSLIH